MRRLSFKEPNFECSVEGTGEPFTILQYAANEEQLRERLRAGGYTVRSIKPYAFTSWRKLAKDSRARFTAKVKPYQFNPDVWKAIKQYLYALSNDLCGYCEAKVRVTSKGEVEHYRPKAGVSDAPKHPGYYWLAYEIDNYVPTCNACNTGKGKRNQFPLKPGTPRARGPKDRISKERPLLLHPFKMDPAKHLRFIVGSQFRKLPEGWIEGIDLVGRTSVTVYGLNRDDLFRDRQEVVQRLRIELSQALQDKQIRDRLVGQINAGEREYPSTCRAVLVAWLNEQRAAAERDLGIVGAASGEKPRERRTRRAPHRRRAG